MWMWYNWNSLWNSESLLSNIECLSEKVLENKKYKQKSVENLRFSTLYHLAGGTRTRTLGTRFWRPLLKYSVTRINTMFSECFFYMNYSLYYNFWKRYLTTYFWYLLFGLSGIVICNLLLASNGFKYLSRK